MYKFIYIFILKNIKVKTPLRAMIHLHLKSLTFHQGVPSMPRTGHKIKTRYNQFNKTEE